MVSNLEALEISLTPQHVKFLDSVAPFDIGFPHTMIVRSTSPRRSLYLLFTNVPYDQGDGSVNALLNNFTGHIAYWPRAQPISGAPSK